MCSEDTELCAFDSFYTVIRVSSNFEIQVLCLNVIWSNVFLIFGKFIVYKNRTKCRVVFFELVAV